jgi:hypothetical protein
MFQTKIAEKIKTHFGYPPLERRAVYGIMWKIIVEADDNLAQCWISKATDTHNMQYLLLFHYNNGCTNASQCYVIRTLAVW